MDLSEIRKKYPQYGDMSDEELISKLHDRHYSDIPFSDFIQRVSGKLKEVRENPSRAMADMYTGAATGIMGAAGKVRENVANAFSKETAGRAANALMPPLDDPERLAGWGMNFIPVASTVSEINGMRRVADRSLPRNANAFAQEAPRPEYQAPPLHTFEGRNAMERLFGEDVVSRTKQGELNAADWLSRYDAASAAKKAEMIAALKRKTLRTGGAVGAGLAIGAVSNASE